MKNQTPNVSLANDLVEVLKLLPETQRKGLLADAESTNGKVASQPLANELGIPASTIRVYRRRALEEVRTEMDRRVWEQDT